MIETEPAMIARQIVMLRDQLRQVTSLREARTLKTAITGLEKHFTGAEITDDEIDAFMTVFFGRTQLKAG